MCHSKLAFRSYQDDLLEEIARTFGYNNLPIIPIKSELVGTVFFSIQTLDQTNSQTTGRHWDITKRLHIVFRGWTATLLDPRYFTQGFNNILRSFGHAYQSCGTIASFNS